METTTITASELRERMAARGLRVGDLARESGLYASTVSQILGGHLRYGPSREARLARGILRLGLDRDTPQPTPPPEPVVIRIRPL
jgi:transcriptional regulator with XRE-family HTH domain